MKKIFTNCRIEVEKCSECERYAYCKSKSKKMANIPKRKSSWNRLLKEGDENKIIATIVVLFVALLIWIIIISKLSNNVSAETMKHEMIEDSIIVTSNEPIEEKPFENTEESDVVEMIETEEESEIVEESVKIEQSKTTEETAVSETKEAEEKKQTTETFQKVKSNPTLSSEGPCKEDYYHISNEDKVLIARVVFAEARGESFEGKVAVAAVILNRYFYGEGMGFSRDSIYSVITQKSQFASISQVTKSNLNQVPSCMEAVEAACKGWDPTRKVFEKGAMFFFNPEKISEGAAKKREGITTMKIGNHLFHYDFSKN